MEKQRACAAVLLNRQKNSVTAGLRRISLPALIGLAAIGGFTAQRLSRTRMPSRAARLLLSWRKLSSL